VVDIGREQQQQEQEVQQQQPRQQQPFHFLFGKGGRDWVAVINVVDVVVVVVFGVSEKKRRALDKSLVAKS